MALWGRGHRAPSPPAPLGAAGRVSHHHFCFSFSPVGTFPLGRSLSCCLVSASCRISATGSVSMSWAVMLCFLGSFKTKRGSQVACRNHLFYACESHGLVLRAVPSRDVGARGYTCWLGAGVPAAPGGSCCPWRAQPRANLSSSPQRDGGGVMWVVCLEFNTGKGPVLTAGLSRLSLSASLDPGSSVPHAGVL